MVAVIEMMVPMVGGSALPILFSHGFNSSEETSEHHNHANMEIKQETKGTEKNRRKV